MSTSAAAVPGVLADQLAFHWDHHVRPRLAGMTDAEYLWEPVPGWTLRARGEAPGVHARAVGEGAVTMDFAPLGLFAAEGADAPPFTTIAWRLAHVSSGVLALRNHAHFGGPPHDHDAYPYTLSADEALAQLTEHCERWITGVRSLTPETMMAPCGPAEGPFADDPMVALVMHIQREAIHHLAEVCLLRDLYAHVHAA
jgi:hypothetical protein